MTDSDSRDLSDHKDNSRVHLSAVVVNSCFVSFREHTCAVVGGVGRTGPVISDDRWRPLERIGRPSIEFSHTFNSASQTDRLLIVQSDDKH